MKISIIKETHPLEKRVAVLPSEVKDIVSQGHQVFVEKDAAYGIGIYDKAYEEAGAEVTVNREELFRKDLITKLKAPTEQEFLLQKNNILFSMIHHEQNPEYLQMLRNRGCIGIEMESIKNYAGERYIDATDITGEQGMIYALQQALKSPNECNVLILGYGRVSSAAIKISNQLGAKTKILRREEHKNIEHFLKGKDIVVNGLTWPKRYRDNHHYLIKEGMLSLMNFGGIILDLSVDFPSPIETCRPTTLSNPWYIEHGIKHMSIYGYPGLAPISCSQKYSKQIAPLIIDIANNGLENCNEDIKRAIIDPKKRGYKIIEGFTFEKDNHE